jgi:hypothetical protein
MSKKYNKNDYEVVKSFRGGHNSTYTIQDKKTKESIGGFSWEDKANAEKSLDRAVEEGENPLDITSHI